MAIFDIDGVLADGMPALNESCMTPGDPDWDLYHELILDAPLLDNGLPQLLRHHFRQTEMNVVLLTCREDRIHNGTAQWARARDLPHDELFTRAAGVDNYQHKVAVVTWLRAQGFEPTIAFEDDPTQVELLRKIGVPTRYIHSGYYEPHQPWRQERVLADA